MNIKEYYGVPPGWRFNRHSRSFKWAVVAAYVTSVSYVLAAEAFVDIATDGSLIGTAPEARFIGAVVIGRVSSILGNRSLEASRLPQPEKIPHIPENIILGEE